MTPSPKIPNEKNLPSENSSSPDEFAHPSFHIHHESIVSTDESTSSNSNSDDDTPNSIDSPHGYQLLPQESNSSHVQTNDEEDEFHRFVQKRLETSVDEIRNCSALNSSSYSIESVWSSESFLVDDKKADYIKSFMSAIKLPESSVPLWAQSCSEQDWHEKFRQRLICQQTSFFFLSTNVISSK